jgi:hypothetical protein
VVVHDYNLSYLGGRDQENGGSCVYVYGVVY